MNVYTTCVVCQQILRVREGAADPVHPLCAAQYTPPRDDQLAAQAMTAALAGDDDECRRLYDLVDALHNAPPRLPAAAALYASWGWPVFPLQPGGKAPITRRGFKDASADPAQVQAWWKAHPRANIGLPTGHRFDIVDVDAPAGYAAWWELQASTALPEIHGLVATAGGGLHAYIKPTGGGNLAGFRAGIDYRGAGGYVVAPPSIRADGRRWWWIHKPSPAAVTGQWDWRKPLGAAPTQKAAPVLNVLNTSRCPECGYSSWADQICRECMASASPAPAGATA